ncbi:MAG TPA: ATP-binding protein [Pseudomonadales bacterium]
MNRAWLPAPAHHNEPTRVETRGPFWLRATISVALLAVFGYLRLAVYPDTFVPLASPLALLVCLWHRDLRLLWFMVAVFTAMVLYKGFFLVPVDGHLATDALFGLMQWVNTIVAGVVVHLVIRLTGRLEHTVAQLQESNAALEATNEELAAREEEIAQQNEELQSQTAELEQQTEEINSQAEELLALNEQLSERERSLRDLLDSTAEGLTEAATLDRLGITIQRVLGERAAGAAVLEPAGAEMRVRPLFGLARDPAPIPRERTLADLILSRARAGALADLALRPDLEAPLLAGDRTVRSLAAAPLRLGDAPQGALEVYGTEPSEWQDHDLRIVQWLAEQCGRMLTIAAMRAEREALIESERAARTEAERASHAKDEFVATLSHELRTPLNAVLGWAGVLRESGGRDPERVGKGLEIIERNARQQAQLISDLLDISRINVGKLRLDTQKVDLPLVVESALESVRQMAESKGVRLERSVGAIDREITGDPTRLQQVLWNLLTNAIKFTPSGGSVRIDVAQQDEQFVVTVSDTGEGIPPGELPLLFQRYRQGDDSSMRQHGGLGLGLAIVKSVVEMHGGTVEAYSAGLGQGATFTVRLPSRPPASATKALEERSGPPAAGTVDTGAALSELSILVVDDERDARELVSHILTERGALVHQAASGEQALEVLEARRPDILISDIGMPGMDGYGLIRRIRERHFEPPLPAIALTAFARPEDRTRVLLAGFQAHVAKPVEIGELIAAVVSLRYTVARRPTPQPADNASGE